MALNVASMKTVKDYFGMLPGQTLKDFTAEWGQLSDDDKAQIKAGLSGETPSLTY
jgi:hypothetical protein